MYVCIWTAEACVLSWAGWLPCLTRCLSISEDDMTRPVDTELCCAELPAARCSGRTQRSVRYRVQSAVCILHSPPCAGQSMWKANQRFAVFCLCRAVGAAPLHPTIASADGGYVLVEMPGQRLDYSRYCPRSQSQRAVEGPRHRWCGLRRDTWAYGRVWLLAGTRVVEPVGTCSTGGYAVLDME